MVNKFMFIYGGTSYLILFTMSILLAGTSLGIGFAEDDDELTKEDVDSLCDASEDYEGHEEECDKLYEQVEDEEDEEDDNDDN